MASLFVLRRKGLISGDKIFSRFFVSVGPPNNWAAYKLPKKQEPVVKFVQQALVQYQFKVNTT